jgi:hypothetical protein
MECWTQRKSWVCCLQRRILVYSQLERKQEEQGAGEQCAPLAHAYPDYWSVGVSGMTIMTVHFPDDVKAAFDKAFEGGKARARAAGGPNAGR